MILYLPVLRMHSLGGHSVRLHDSLPLHVCLLGLYVMEVSSRGILMTFYSTFSSTSAMSASQWRRSVLWVLNILYLAILHKGSLALFVAEVNKFRNIINMHLSSCLD